jgi:prepilin-type processing-associated H-X9-DG protein
MPIDFRCPHCGVSTEVADQYAGQSGACAYCGKMITVPLPGGVGQYTGGGLPPRRGLGAGWIVLIVAMAVIPVLLICGGVLVAMFRLVPVMQNAGEAVQRAQCNNSLKQIGLAMYNYQQKYGCFPPAFVADKSGKPMHSWRVLLLPFLEEKALYDDYRFDEPWNSPHNSTLASRMPLVYHCFADGPLGGSQTSYAMLVGPHAISDGPHGRKPSEVKDGLSNTIILAEAAHAGINWMEPRDLKTENMRFQINGGVGGSPASRAVEISSRHPDGAHVLMGDGAVQFLSDMMEPKELEAMTTIDGGETVTPSSF